MWEKLGGLLCSLEAGRMGWVRETRALAGALAWSPGSWKGRSEGKVSSDQFIA